MTKAVVFIETKIDKSNNLQKKYQLSDIHIYQITDMSDSMTY